MLDFLVELSPKFKLLKNPVAIKTFGNIATLSQAASIGGVAIADKIKKTTSETISISLGDTTVESLDDHEARQEILKDIYGIFIPVPI